MIERTFDTKLVREILSDEELRKRGGKYVPIEAYDPENQQELIYLLVKDEDKVLGVILYREIHHGRKQMRNKKIDQLIAPQIQAVSNAQSETAIDAVTL